MTKVRAIPPRERLNATLHGTNRTPKNKTGVHSLYNDCDSLYKLSQPQPTASPIRATLGSNAALAASRRADIFPHAALDLARTRRNLLLVGRGNDVLAGVGRGQHALCVREEFHERPVEQAGGEEGVDVADGKAAEGLVYRRARSGDEGGAYRCLPPLVMLMVLRETLLMKPGSGGRKPIIMATTLRQLVA